jgi:hypothetical protein
MRQQLRNVTVAAAITTTMLISGASGRAAAGEAPGDGASPLCYPPVVDPMSRQYIELNIVEIPGAIIGPPRPTCQNSAPPDCYAPIVDPDSRRYVEWELVEVPGAVFGPPRPTCQAPEQTVMPL